MIQSMTGYGRGFAADDGREITIEIKSVNHRYLDISMRLPRYINFLEDPLRELLGKYLSRGHVDLYVNYRNTRNDARTIEVDRALIGQYLAAAADIAEAFSLSNDIGVTNALALPDAMRLSEAAEDRDAVHKIAQSALTDAISELKTMRLAEGERLAADLFERIEALAALREEIAVRAPLVVEEYSRKLNERVEKLLSEVEVDRARLATEIALFADRASIDEELTRLRSHFEQFFAALSSGEAVGRKLEFLVQELNREFNTIGSKANDAALTNAVLQAKAEIEKIREQVQNIE